MSRRLNRTRKPRVATLETESLERRTLLTTLLGGEQFLFADDEGQGVLVQATGDIIVELIGARFLEAPDSGTPQAPVGPSTASIGDIPGVLYRDGQPINVGGGYAPLESIAVDTGNGVEFQDVRTLSGLWGILVTRSSPDATLVVLRVEDVEEPDFNNGIFFPTFTIPEDITDDTGALLGLRDGNGSLIPSLNARNYAGSRPPGFAARGNITPFIDVRDPIGKFYFNGLITGAAIFQSNLGVFYADTLGTGDLTGTGLADNDNFAVLGDVGTVVVRQTSETVDFAVNGRVGVVFSGEDANLQFDVVGQAPARPLSVAIEELESPGGGGEELLAGQLPLDYFVNDTPATAQPVFTGYNSTLRKGNSAVIRGSISPDPTTADNIDHYALPLLAGQTATIQITSRGFLPVSIGVFDPQGRLIASDRSNLNTDNRNLAFRIVADSPGIYTLAAVPLADLDFNGQADDGLLFAPAPHPYEIRITNASESTVGAIRALNDIVVRPLDARGPVFRVRNGDLGMVWANGDVRGNRGTIRVDAGNLRVVQADDIGQTNDAGVVAEAVNLNVVKGNVGLLRSSGALMSVNPNAVSQTGAVVASLAIGGNYQVVDAAGLFVGNLTANGGIGTVRAGRMDDLSRPPLFAVNVDKSGKDGFIDLIDVAGDMGTLARGGPVLDAGPGGNIRYIRVGGQVYRDRFFGGGVPETTTFSPGKSATINDDSGTILTIKPSRFVNFTANPVTVVDGVLTVTTLPVRSGGSVILNVTSTTSVTIESSSGGKGAEISRLSILGTSGALEDDENRGLVLPANQPTLDLRFSGSQRVDIFSLLASNLRKLSNPFGEIVIATLGDVETVEVDSLGSPRSSSGAQIQPLGVIAGGTNYPFANQPFGVNFANVKNLRTYNGMGNVIVSGIVQNLTANADGRFTKGVNEGITGPIVVGDELRFANIGEGILPSGTGEFSRAGIYATGEITRLVNQGPGSDIRGDVISLTRIGSIELNGGSIIDADILVNTPFESGLEIAPITPPTPPVLEPPAEGEEPPEDTLNNPYFTIGGIAISKGGGIIGSLIAASAVGNVNINGFGGINSQVVTTGTGTLNQFTTTGLGLRSMNLEGGANTNYAIAYGTTGKLLDVRSFSPSVRNSDNSAFDPYSGIAINPSNDLNAFLGTGKNVPKLSGVTNEGVIRDTLVTGSRNLGYVQAYQIDVSSTNDLPTTDPLFPSRISFGSKIGTILTYGPLAGLQVTAGQIDKLSVGGDISNSSFTVSGTVGEIYAKGSIRGSSYLTVGGPEGIIRKMTVRRSLFGQIVANRFGDVFVGRDVGTGRLRSFGSINTLDIDGNVLTGAYVRASGSIKNLFIGGDIQQGATVRATSFSNQQIDGVIAGDLVVG